MIRPALLMFLCTLVTACGFLPDDTGPAPIYTYGSGKGVGSTGSHMVTSGDTLTNVAKRYGLTVSDLAEKNGLTPTSQLKIGQRLSLPRPRDYKVRDGDTARIVANTFDMSAADVARLNRLKDSTHLQPGQVLSLSREKLNKLVQQVVQSPFVPPPSKPSTAPKPAVATGQLQSVPKGKTFMTPVRGRVVSGFGTGADGRQNDGVNIAAALGTPVQAARSGEVVYAAGDIAGYGNMVLIKHENSYVTVYAHLDRIAVEKGDHVRQGQMIGTVGQTGAIASPQLHFEIRRGKATENPAKHVTLGL